jgi:hypothetical protein
LKFLHQIGRSDFLEEESIDMLFSQNILFVKFEVFFLLFQPKLLSQFPHVLDNHVNDVRNEGQADEDHKGVAHFVLLHSIQDKVGERKQMITNNQNHEFVDYFHSSFDSVSVWINVDDKDDVETGEQGIELDLNGG